MESDQQRERRVLRDGDRGGEILPSPDEDAIRRTLGVVEGLRIVLVALAAIAVRLHLGQGSPILSLVAIAGVAFGGWPVFREAVENAAARRMTMELSMSIAIVAAAAVEEFFTALIITLFVLVAEVLEVMTVSRGRRAIRELLELLPRSVSVRAADGVREVSTDELRAGDHILVSPGGAVPVDGVVTGGHSFVDESRITGESLPVEKPAGAQVYASTINQTGALEICVERIGRDTSYGKIVEAVETAERSRAPVQQLADRLAGYLVYFTLAAATLTFIVTRDIRTTISVVIVAGACGIAAGTPLAILGAIGRAARLGAIVKGGLHLETLGRVNTVVLDKTGTLTFGRPEAQGVFAGAGVSEAEVLKAAASAELRSEHPFGKAIVARAVAEHYSVEEPERFDYRPGRGITAAVDGATIIVGSALLLKEHGINVPRTVVANSGASEIFVARRGRFLGSIEVADTVRPEARSAVEALHRMGIRAVLLTGDARSTADKVARELGITEVEAELLPDDKLERVRSLVTNRAVVAMVGDGINDAPAMTAADVGVAMGSGTDVARESADVVLLGNDLARFTQILEIARWTRRIIWQNFAGTIAIDAVGIILAAVGLLSPASAAFVHVASETAFILNSARLLPRTRRRSEVAGSQAAAEEKSLPRAA